ncbi:MAG: hypothetical protein FWF81_09895 [Defluviitaleaceae bacterium]|nr:hypothetical protein [Defluviitaleaceae bacterium]
MENWRKYLTTFTIWSVLCILVAIGFREANIIQRFSNVSLRFSEPVSGDAAYRARQFSIENDTFWPTFWHQTHAELTVGARTANANAILFSGDASLVWHTRYIAGSAPSPIDAYGIAISETLAHRLWGSADIIGKSLYVDEETRIVRGIFEGRNEIALLSFHIECRLQNWTAAELYGGEPLRINAENYSISAGLGSPDYIITGGAMASRFMSFAPILMLVIFGAFKFAKTIKMPSRTNNLIGGVIVYAGLIIIAILLPFALNALPPWLIPTGWSDFSFWSDLLQQGGDSIREFLSVAPALRDVELKIYLLRLAGITLVTLCYLCRFYRNLITLQKSVILH